MAFNHILITKNGNTVKITIDTNQSIINGIETRGFGPARLIVDCPQQNNHTYRVYVATVHLPTSIDDELTALGTAQMLLSPYIDGCENMDVVSFVREYGNSEYYAYMP